MDSKQWVKQRLQDRARRRDQRWRRLPEFGRSESGGEPTVYYFAPEENTPSGGVRVIYRHVDRLNEMGIDAAVVHKNAGFRCTWFENSTRVISAAKAGLSPKDLLVLPEYTSVSFDSVPTGVRVVVFNQGPHHTFDGVPLGTRPYEQLKQLKALLTVSEDGKQLLSMAFPGVPVWQVRNVIDPALFHLGENPANQRVSYVPSRRSDELGQLLHVLGAQPEFASGEWTLMPLQGLSESAMAQALRETSIFISLSHREGFGLPPAEAMACGAYVVGHHGGGGREFFNTTFCSPANDNTDLAKAVMNAVRMPESHRRQQGQLASRQILERYSAGNMREDLAKFYAGLL